MYNLLLCSGKSCSKFKCKGFKFFLKKLEKNLSSDVSITVKKVKSSNKSKIYVNKFLTPEACLAITRNIKLC